MYVHRVIGKAGRKHPRKRLFDGINEIFKEKKIRNNMNRKACQNGCMDVKEAKEVCKDRKMCMG